MDEQLRRNERRARQEGDGSASLRQARDLWRAGQASAAREALYERLAQRRIGSETLTLARDLGLADGRVGRGRGERLRAARVERVALRRGDAQVVPTLAFVGLPGADAARGVEALQGLLGHDARAAHAGDRVRTYRVTGGERVVDFLAPIRTPWRASRGFTVPSLRVFNAPGGLEASKVRRQLLRSASALVLVAGSEAEDGELRGLVRALDRDLRWVGGVGLDALPLAIHYGDSDGATRHQERASALGAPHAGWWASRRGAPVRFECAGELLAMLLLEIRDGLGRLVRPRGSV